MAYYDANKNGISVYEKSMTSVVMIPTTDEMEEYYMSRTKTAIGQYGAFCGQLAAGSDGIISRKSWIPVM